MVQEYLKQIEFSSDVFRHTDELETAFSNALRSAKFAGQILISGEAIRYFPDLNDVVAEKCLLRKR